MKKVAVVLGWFAITNLFVVQSAQAAVVEVDVTVKSVDAKARGITVIHETKLGTKASTWMSVEKSRLRSTGNRERWTL